MLDQLPLLPMILLALALGGGATTFVQDGMLSQWLLSAPRVGASGAPAGPITNICGGARIDCVVDGDTFWWRGEKYRIADIDTPEVSNPSCAAEAVLGQRATHRLAALLGEAPFELMRGDDPDRDQYGRKLRIVMREGQSVGQVLVAEGLAHDWGGYRRGWC
jgi:micrococcal nuclease